MPDKTDPLLKLNQDIIPELTFPLIIKLSINLSLVIVPEAMWLPNITPDAIAYCPI